MCRIEIKGKRYLSVPTAAKELGVSRMTVYRWVTGQVDPKLDIQAFLDPISGHYYVSEQSVTALLDRYQPVG